MTTPVCRLACDFFDDFILENIVEKLALQKDFFTVWLNNQGENLIAFLPETSFTVYFSENPNLFKLVMVSHGKRTEQLLSFEQIQAILIAFCQKNQLDSETTNHQYQNGLIGFISYDFSAVCLANLTKHQFDKNKPCAYFGHYPFFLQKIADKWQLISYIKHHDDLEKIYNQLQDIVITTHNIAKNIAPKPLSAVWQVSDYQLAFDKVQDYLYAGDCYQINLTQCWQGITNQPLVHDLQRFRSALSAPFSGYLGIFGEQNYEILSCSPELFFTFARSDTGIELITKPIKGTRPRHHETDKDEILKNELKNSEKDTAENVMIVDLLRNDLGKYAKTGSVRVPKLFEIESFSNVHHLVSTICATIKDDTHPLAVLFGSLPAGSITGTPKKRAVEIIHELESDNRGAYCGTLGYLNFNGEGQWNVLIRTLQSYQNQVSVWAGGGVTIASDCQAEYQECFDKVGNLLKAFTPD